MKYEDNAVIEGTRLGPHGAYVKVEIDGQPLGHAIHHSDGFEWGYGGSGPADLALSILDEVIDEPKTVKIFLGRVGKTAWDLHQKFKWQFVTGWGDEWSITVGQVREWVKAQST